jgi:nitrous oxidase accessory protein NosD
VCVVAEGGESLGKDVGCGVAVTSDVVANATATRTNENLNMIGNLQGLYLMESVDKEIKS